jgi:hypothetical protein
MTGEQLFHAVQDGLIDPKKLSNTQARKIARHIGVEVSNGRIHFSKDSIIRAIEQHLAHQEMLHAKS